MLFLEGVILHSLLVNFHGFLLLSLLVSVDVHSLLVFLDIVDHIDICPVDILESPLGRVDSHSHGLVDSDDLHSVTWLHEINQVLISTQMDGLGSLAFWDTLGSFLELHVLLVTEHAHVVEELE